MQLPLGDFLDGKYVIFHPEYRNAFNKKKITEDKEDKDQAQSMLAF